MDKSTFIKVYASLLEDVRKEIIVVIDNKPYTWDSVYIEIIKGTKLGGKILKKLTNMGFD